MTTHVLKTWPAHFSALEDGRKQFEVRKNDRGFELDDTVILLEYRPSDHVYTGRALAFFVTYITDLAGTGIEGFVAMGLRRVEELVVPPPAGEP